LFDWDDIRIFLAVARFKKIALAARQLGIDPTTLSRRIGRLEEALGARLFDVGSSGRLLSERGQAMLNHAERVESAALAAMEDVTGEAYRLSGQVRVSVAEGFCTHILAPGIADFNAQHPGIKLDLVTASGFLNPSKREADMAVMLARPQKGRLSIQRLGDYTLHLYGTPAYLERAGKPTSPAGLFDHVLVGYVPDFIFSPELDYLNEVYPGLDAQIRSTSINVQHRMVIEGAGIGVLPDFIGSKDERLIPLLTEEVRIVRSFWLVIHEDLRKLPRIEAVARWLKQRVLAT
jgi:DNA-binding transcriptional LysR family regulator